MTITSNVFNTTRKGGTVSDLASPIAVADGGTGATALVNALQVYHGVQSIGTVSFNSTNKTIDITDATTYWYKGVKKVTGILSCDLDLSADRDHADATLTPNTLYFIYFKDATGKLYWSPTVWDLKEKVPIATIFWNGTAGAIHKEWHNHTRDLDWHINAHLTIGARYYSGLALTKPTTSFDANLDLTTGYIYDEDLLFTITNPTTARSWYQASAGVYTFADISLPYLGTSGDCSYLDTDTYALTSVTASKYVCYWVYGSGDIDRPIYIIPTHAASPYNTLALARVESVPVLSGMGLNPEIKLLYRFIYRGDGEFQEATDYRLASSLPIGATPTPAASSVTVVPTGNIAATNVQTALEELDLERNKFDEVVIAATGSITSAYFNGTVINTYGQTDDIVLTVDAATKGANFKVVIGTTVAKYVRIDPAAGDSIFPDGLTTTGDGKYIGNASVTKFDEIYFESIQTGASDYDWKVTSGLGAWVQES